MNRDTIGIRLTPEENNLAVASVTMNFVARGKMRSALEEYTKMPSKERPVLSAFLIGRRIITPRENSILRDYPKKRILRCSACTQEFDVTRIEPGRQFECPKCTILVTVPAVVLNFDLLSTPASFQRIDIHIPSPSFDIEALEPNEFARELEKDGIKIMDQIGRGGMGVVFLAEDTKLKRKVAVKVLLAGALASQSQIARFDREAEAVASIRHPNVVSVYSLGEFKGQRYFTMDYIEGTPLDKLIAREQLSANKAAELCSAICGAVHAGHEAGVIHRDLKPGNVLLDARLKPYVTDFGLAKLEDSTKSLTESGIALGTPHYMSPEQASGDVHEIGRPSDIYSLGIILYEMLCGKVPFEGTRAVDIMMKVMNEDPPPPRHYNRSIPLELEAICLKAISKHPSNRYSTAEEMASDLEAWLAGRTIIARPPGPMRKTGKFVRRHKIAFSLIATFLATGLLSLYYFKFLAVTDTALTAVIEAIDAMSLNIRQGNYDRFASVVTMAESFPDNPTVARKIEALQTAFRVRLHTEYSELGDLRAKAEPLALLLRFFPSERATLDDVGDMNSRLANAVNEEMTRTGPRAAGMLLQSVLSTLGNQARAVDGTRDAFVRKLNAAVDSSVIAKDIEGAIEHLQVLQILSPDDISIALRIDELRNTRQSDFYELINRVMGIVGFGTVRIVGAHHSCRVEIESLADESDSRTKVYGDLRVQPDYRLKNGFYLFHFFRDGFKSVEKGVTVEADKEHNIEIAENEWVPE